MKKYQVGIEFTPTGDVKSTRGLIHGKAIAQVKSLVKLNKKTNTYLHIWFDKDQKIVEINKLTKKEYMQLSCGLGLTDFGDFISGLL